MPHLSIDLLPLGCAIAGLVAVGICLVQISSKKPEVPFLCTTAVLGLGPLIINILLPKENQTYLAEDSGIWIWAGRDAARQRFHIGKVVDAYERAYQQALITQR